MNGIMMKIINKIFNIAARRIAKHGHNVSCCICNNKSNHFLPYKGGWKEAPPLMAALSIIGSDLNNVECPHCGSSDRERHLYLYMERLGLWKHFAGATLLHFAPENGLSSIIENKSIVKYVRADLYPTGPNIAKMDLQNIPFNDNTFDVIIANHVLEHVSDDILALQEIHRVLRPGGIAILQVPYSAKLVHSFSDPGINEDESRLQAYGQEDHVRLYGKDIFQRIESVGFKSRVASHDAVLSDISASYYGVNEREPLFLFEGYK